MHLRNDGGPSFSRDGPEVYSFGNFPATQAPYIMGAKTSKDNTVGGAVGGMESGEFGKSGDFGSSSFLLAKEDDPPQGIPSSASAAKKQQQHSSRRPPDASIKTELATVLETSAATRPDLNASPSSAFTPSPPQTTKNTTTSKDSRGSGGAARRSLRRRRRRRGAEGRFPTFAITLEDFAQFPQPATQGGPLEKLQRLES